MSLVTPSGGLVYHLRALRYARTLWAPFREALAQWLAASLPLSEERELILVGPSAGHCLPLDRFRAVPRILVLEPDPLARFLLARRLAPSRVELEPRDLLVAPLLQGQRALEGVLERWPRAALLFCNVLGQLHFSLSDAQQQAFQQAFSERVVPLLSGRRWASFHDRWSLDWDGARQAPPLVRRFEQLPSDAELGEAWFGTAGEAVTALDHGTTPLFPEARPRTYLSWRITPSALHVVEAVASGD